MLLSVVRRPEPVPLPQKFGNHTAAMRRECPSLDRVAAMRRERPSIDRATGSRAGREITEISSLDIQPEGMGYRLCSTSCAEVVMM